MKPIALFLTALVAVEHLVFLVLEMFFWTSPAALRAFNTTPEFAAATAAMAAHQGLYNGFLAAGLLWGMKIDSGRVKLFFLTCVIVAGVFGAVTVKASIVFVQALPALAAAVCVLLDHRARADANAQRT